MKFDKKEAPKTVNVLVRFDKEVDEELREIAKLENATISSVIREFVKVGLDTYKEAFDAGN